MAVLFLPFTHPNLAFSARRRTSAYDNLEEGQPKVATDGTKAEAPLSHA